MKLLLLAAATCLGFSAHAGRLQGVTLSGAPSLTVIGGYAQASPLQATITIANASGRSLRLGLQRQIRSEVAGSENNFCFGVNCYPPNVTTAPSPITLANAANDNSMVLDYTPNNQAGITTIRYAVYEVGTQDSTYVTVRFDASQRVLAVAASRAAESVLGMPYPNPAVAGEVVQLTHGLSANAGGQLRLISLATGHVVREQDLSKSSGVRLCGNGLGDFNGIAAGGCFPGGTIPTGSEARIVVSTDGLAPGLYGCLLLDGRGQLLAARRLLVK